MKAMQAAIDKGNRPLIDQMIENWPFFHSRLSMLDMVFSKADVSISEEYDKRLVPDELRYFGQALRDELPFLLPEHPELLYARGVQI